VLSVLFELTCNWRGVREF